MKKHLKNYRSVSFRAVLQRGISLFFSNTKARFLATLEMTKQHHFFRCLIKFAFATLLFTSLAFSGERKVLVEMFTNSHCAVCPPAHAALNSFKSNSVNANRVRYIFYHTTFPYPSDPLSQANTTEPNARNSYYNGPTSTPNTFFDGANQGRTYASFAANLESRLLTESPLEIQLSGNKNGTSISITASIKQTAAISQSDLVLHVVAVENVSYVGSNGVSPQDFVMRKMMTPIAGESFAPEMNVAKFVTKNGLLTNATSMENVGVVVFIQSVSTKEVFQSEYISYSTLTNIGSDLEHSPIDFSLEQNFPNPFNPSTTIRFTLRENGRASLKIYDVFGKEIGELIDSQLSAGAHNVVFSALEYNLASGVYFYRLTSNGRTIVRRMMLLK